SHDPFRITHESGRAAVYAPASCRSPDPVPRRSRFDRADLQHRRHLDQLRFVLVGVMLAEEQLGAGRKLGPNASGRAAAVTPVSSGQLGTGQSCVHGSSILLPIVQAPYRPSFGPTRISTVSDETDSRVVPPRARMCRVSPVRRGSRPAG